MNWYGNQAYLENAIQKAGGATNFEAIITYPDTKAQIPSKYQIGWDGYTLGFRAFYRNCSTDNCVRVRRLAQNGHQIQSVPVRSSYFRQ